MKTTVAALAPLLALDLLVACAAGGADGGSSAPRARLLSERVAFVGANWDARLRISGSRLRPAFVYGGRAARMRRSGNIWIARVSFARAGRVALSVRLGPRTFPLGAVTVGYRVRQPMRIEAEPGGTLLVADMKANAILRLDTRTGVAAKAADLPSAIAVARGGDGTVFAIGDDRLYRLGAGTLRLVADLTDDSPLDVAPGDDGSVYVATYGERVLRVTPGGAVSTFAHGLDHPHGIAVARGGALFLADSHSDTLKRIAPDGSVAIVASGLMTPSDVLVEADGAVLVVEHRGSRITRVDPSSRKSTVLAGLGGPVSVTRGEDGTLYVAQLSDSIAVGRLDQASGRLVRVSR